MRPAGPSGRNCSGVSMPSATQIRLLVIDVDGTLTDGRIYIDQAGNEMKSFYAHDGTALKLLMESGILVAFITARTSQSVPRWAAELGVVEIYQGVEDKFSVLSELQRKYSLNLSQVAYIGDDLSDLPLVRQVGSSYAPADARPIVREFARHVTSARGGQGAVAECCEDILRRQGKWDDLVSKYL